MIAKHSPLIFRFTAGLVSVFLIVYGLQVLQDILVPLIFSAILTMLLLPMNAKMESWGFPRVLAILLSILITLSLLGGLGYLVYWQITELQELIPLIIQKSEIWLRAIQKFIAVHFRINAQQQLAEGQKYLITALKENSSVFSAALSGTTGFLANFSLMPLYIFLMLLYRDFFHVFLYKLFSSVSNPRLDVVVGKIKEIILDYMVGLLLVILIIGSLNTISLWVLGIDHALFLGFFAGALVLIPYIGIAIGSLLPIFVALLTKDSYLYAVGVAGSFAVVQFLEGNFITPLIVGTKVSINSMVAIVSLILFGNLWGMAGLVLALPLTAILKVIFDSVDALRPWGFLLGDADHMDVKKIKKIES